MKSAFTLIELLVVLALIFIIGTIFFESCNSQRSTIQLVRDDGQRKHWKDTNTGECAWTVDSDPQNYHQEACQ